VDSLKLLVNKVSSSICGNILRQTIMDMSSKNENRVNENEDCEDFMNDVINEMVESWGAN
jgi:hypothetical protein